MVCIWFQFYLYYIATKYVPLIIFILQMYLSPLFSCNTNFMMNYLTQWLVISCSVTYIIIPTCSDECLMLPHLNYTILILLTIEMKKIYKYMLLKLMICYWTTSYKLPILMLHFEVIYLEIMFFIKNKYYFVC